MAQVTVVEQTDGLFTVTVADGGRTTTHTVRVPADLPSSLGCPHVRPVDLVRSSFAFLLEREPAGSILRRFSLEQITDYFPDDPEEIRAALAR